MTEPQTGGFEGWHRRVVPSPDPELTQVGPGTPAGEYLRRTWQPIAMLSEVGERPILVRVLGEDLVLFRDGSGRLGLLHRHCCHRGVSLEFGLIMERGISCCYHGWQYDVDGRLLDAPAEPPDSPVYSRVRQGAYPVATLHGLVFAWLGDPDDRPPPPDFDTLHQPETDAVPFSLEMPCNWLQVYENTQDPVHVVYLHTRISGAQFGDASGATQHLTYLETPLGMINVQTRRWGDHVWNRTTESILPNMNQGGAVWEAADRTKIFRRTAFTRWMLPVDDTNTRVIGWRLFNDLLDPTGQGDRTKVGKQSIDFIGQVEDRPYAERQRQPGDFEALTSQRAIAVHALENLATSDRGVVMLRRLIRQGLRDPESRPLAKAVCDGEGRVTTYCQDTVWPAEPVDRAHADLPEVERLARFGAAVASATLTSAGGLHTERERAVEARVSAAYGPR